MGAELRSEEGLTSNFPMLRSLFDASIVHFFDAEMISVFYPTNIFLQKDPSISLTENS